MFVWVCVCVLVYLSVSLSVCLSVCLCAHACSHAHHTDRSLSDLAHNYCCTSIQQHDRQVGGGTQQSYY